MILDESVTGRMSWGGIIIAGVVFLAVIPALAQNTPTGEQIARDAIEKRYARLQSLVVRYDRIDIYTPIDRTPHNDVIRNEAGEPVELMFGPIIGTEVEERTFHHLNDLSRVEVKVVKGTSPYGYPHQMWSYFPAKVEVYLKDHNGRASGDIRPDRTGPPAFLIDLALGLRLFGERTPLTDAQLDQFELDVSDENVVVLRTAWWRGMPNAKIVHEWHFDPRLNHALVAYRRVVNGALAEEFTLGNFLDVEGVQLPELIKYRTSYRGLRDSQTTVIRVDRYELNDPENTPESYAIDWPEGTRMVRR